MRKTKKTLEEFAGFFFSGKLCDVCEAHPQWSMVNGQWSIVNGQ
jgi:hypothetical protein